MYQQLVQLMLNRFIRVCTAHTRSCGARKRAPAHQVHIITYPLFAARAVKLVSTARTAQRTHNTHTRTRTRNSRVCASVVCVIAYEILRHAVVYAQTQCACVYVCCSHVCLCVCLYFKIPLPLQQQQQQQPATQEQEWSARAYRLQHTHTHTSYTLDRRVLRENTPGTSCALATAKHHKSRYVKRCERNRRRRHRRDAQTGGARGVRANIRHTDTHI